MRLTHASFFAPLLLAAAGGMTWASSAQAHISIDMGGTHNSRYAGTDLKSAPCGKASGTRGSNIYTYKPGETINISVKETIPHPGYFRIAFDNDGDNDFVTPSGTDGVNGNCAGDAKCGLGKEDYCNNSTVLLDNLNPHTSAAGLGTYTWSVTLPNVECDNCTLQIIQVMNDLNIHFSPYPADDVYYACIDLVLSNTADDVSETPVTNIGMDCTGGGGAAGTGSVPVAGTGGGTAGATAGAGGGEAGSGSEAGGGSAGTSAGIAGVGGGTAGSGSTAGGAGVQVSGAGNVAPDGAAGAGTSKSDSGGCAVSHAGSSGAGGPGWGLVLAAAAAWTVRARRRR